MQLIFPNEKMALKDGLLKPEAQEQFSKTLYERVLGEDQLKERFEIFSNVLGDIDAAKWTTASYFLFILLPEKYMFANPQFSSILLSYVDLKLITNRNLIGLLTSRR